MKTTQFSEFIRNASSREKKRVYSAVLINATKRQNKVVKKAKDDLNAALDGTCSLY